MSFISFVESGSNSCHQMTIVAGPHGVATSAAIFGCQLWQNAEGLVKKAASHHSTFDVPALEMCNHFI